MHTILFGVASQTLEHVPSEHVASATYVIEDLLYDVDDTANRVLASGAATVDSLSLTLDDAAGATQVNPRQIPVSATTGAEIGDPVFVRAADGTPWEHATIAGISSGAYLLTEHPLVGEYPSGSSVLGAKVSADFPDIVSADEDLVLQDRRLRVVWTYTIGGQTRKVQEPIQIRRHRDGSAYEGAVISRLRDAFPDLAERMPTGATLHGWVSFCVEDLRARSMAKGVDPALFLSGDQGVQALLYRVVLHAADNGQAPGNMPSDIWREQARDYFDFHWNSLMTGIAGQSTVEINRENETRTDTPAGYRSPLGPL